MATDVRLSGASLQTTDGLAVDSSMIAGAASSDDLAAVTAADVGAVPATRTVNTQTDDYTLVAADANAIVEMEKGTANTLTIPAAVFAEGDRITVVQTGAGATTIDDDTTSTMQVDAAFTLVLSGQWAVAEIYCRGSDVFVVSGGLTAAV